jgi:hypothetical protein
MFELVATMVGYFVVGAGIGLVLVEIFKLGYFLMRNRISNTEVMDKLNALQEEFEAIRAEIRKNTKIQNDTFDFLTEMNSNELPDDLPAILRK